MVVRILTGGIADGKFGIGEVTGPRNGNVTSRQPWRRVGGGNHEEGSNTLDNPFSDLFDSWAGPVPGALLLSFGPG